MSLLRAETAYFDQHQFDPKAGVGMHEQLAPIDRKLAHIGWHVGKVSMTKLVEFRQTSNISLMQKQIIPDLALYATQLANIFDLPDEVFNHGALPPFDFLRIDDQVRLAAGAFPAYIEPREHEPESTSKLVFTDAARMLHRSALEFGIEYGLSDIRAAQLERMESNLGRPIPEVSALDN